jgi:hypothetical protein
MKNKINKDLLLKEKGFVWHDRYSSNEFTDDMGRWARIGYYNGFIIAWVSGMNDADVKLSSNKHQIVTCNSFYVQLFFPCSSNQGGESKWFETIEDAKKYAEEMFLDFKSLIL